MEKITIIDKEYVSWVKDLASRYRQSQIKAAVKVNREILNFYWNLGRDIVVLKAEARWGDKFLKTLSADLNTIMPEAGCFSETNLKYMKYFYEMYESCLEITPQLFDENSDLISPQLGDKTLVRISPQLGDKLTEDLFSIPWGHHKCLIDKFKKTPDKALFYVRKTIENGWSRAMLLNFLDTNLYEREGKAITNFTATLPEPMSDLAKAITKDPYNFAFAGITGRYNETQLKKALLTNITEFLIELGTGFAYVGKEYRLQIGDTENFIDLLFYHLNLRCYVVIEVKVDKFTPGDIGQLGTYVVACNHLLKRPDDNPTIGMLVCKSKDNTIAQYALEGSSQPIGISEYDLEKLYPTKVEGLIPTIEEIEAKLEEYGKDR